MIVILHADDVDLSVAESLQEMFEAEYGNRLEINIIGESAASVWPRDPSWDDLIVLLFNLVDLTPNGKGFMDREMVIGGRERPVLPIACGSRNVPPEPVGKFKAIPLDLKLNSRRVGAILGMSLRNRDQLIFVSYRAADGTALAVQVQEFLAANGYRFWRDEARDEYDDEGFLPGGCDVQTVIEDNLKNADLILLLDTPSAAESKWIKLEVDTANGLLIPVLPVLVKRAEEKKIVSRFRSLASLQRGITVTNDGGPFSDAELQAILKEIEDFLSDVYRRRLRVPFLVEKEFIGRGYEWTERDHIIYEALKTHSSALRTRVYNHCSHFEGIFDPSLVAFIKHIQASTPAANYALYIYDGSVLSSSDIDDIRRAAKIDDDTNVIILHNQEIGALLHTHFTSLKT